MTVKNDAAGAAVTLDSLARQSRRPDEIIIADGGSTDDTRDLLTHRASVDPVIRIIDAPGANIARGRNLAIAAAESNVIASIDGGCRAEPAWLEHLTAPFERNPGAAFVGGFYRIESQSLLEEVIGLATMRGQLEPVDPATFNPSARSVAFTKELWQRAGGFPEHLDFSEDTQFDHTVRSLNVRWEFAENAVVHWRPRANLRALARQFYCYGTGRGLTGIDAASFHYNLRNLVVVLALAPLCWFSDWLVAPALIAAAYVYWWSFHEKAVAITRRSRRLSAYPLTFLVTWTVMCANLAGYLVGSWRRRRRRTATHVGTVKISIHPKTS